MRKRSQKEVLESGSDVVYNTCNHGKSLRFSIMYVLIAALFFANSADAGRFPTPALTTSSVTATSVGLRWTDPTSGEIDWTVERTDVSGGTFVVLARLPANSIAYTDSTVAPNKTYYYRAGYLTSKNGRKYSNTLTVRTLSLADTTAPQVTVTAPAAGSLVGGTVTLNVSATDNVGVTRVDYYVDGAFVGSSTASPFSKTFDTRTKSDGSHGVSAIAFDAVGNQGSSPTVTFQTDNTAPSIPSAPVAAIVSGSQLYVSWNASTDNAAGVSSYRVYRNGTLVGSPSTTSFLDSGLAGNTQYCYTIAAVDAIGNVSPTSAAGCATTPDTSAPSIPTGLSVSAPSCTQVNISWNTSTDAGSGVRSYWVFRNGAAWREVLAPATSTTDTSVSTSTTYSYAVAARDFAGNQSSSSPTASVTTPACGDSIAPTTPGNFVAFATDCRTAYLAWNAATDSGGSGLKGYNIYRNGAFLAQVGSASSNSLDSTLTASTTYSYAVSSVDNAGNESPRSVTLSVMTPACPDNVAPTTPTGVAAASTDCSTVTVSWSPSIDSGGSGLRSYNVYRNGAFLKTVMAPGTSATDTAISPSVSYSYALTAVDYAGNVSSMSSPASITPPPCLDIIPPTVPANVTATVMLCTQIDVKWNASSDTGTGVKGYRIYRDGSFVKEVLSPAISWSDTTVSGATTCSYIVTAFDNAGNVSASSGAASATTPSCTTATGRFVAMTLLGGTDSDYGMAVALDKNGNLFAGGSMGGGPYIAKISPNLQVLWNIWLANAGSVQAVAADPNGDVVFTGYYYGTVDFGGGPLTSAGGYDIFIAKYSADGRYLWANRYGSANGADFAGDETALSLAIDASGNIAVVGSYLDSATFGSAALTSRGGKDGFAVKLAPNGATLWAKSFGNTGSDDSANAAAFDAFGNLIVGGRFSTNVDFGGGGLSSVGSYDVFVAKFAPSGAHLWSRRAGGSSFDTVGAVAVDNAGDVIVTGNYRLNANFDGVAFASVGYEDVFLVKYSGVNGAQQWVKSFGSWNTDMGNGVAVDGARNITIAGRLGAPMDFGGGVVSTPRNGYNIYIAKFAPSGAHLWSKALGNGREDARGVTLDSLGFSYTVGRCAYTNDFGGGPFVNTGNSANPDIFILKQEP
jgi:fibronectin type 3 domain-containing protein